MNNYGRRAKTELYIMHKNKIYFTGSIRGGRTYLFNYKKIIKELSKYGKVFGEHVADDKISKFGETDLTSEQILERELKFLNECDIVVAEVTNPSSGVGFLISEALHHRKPVIALFNNFNLYKLSAIIRGCKGVSVYSYGDVLDVELILKEVFDGR